MPHLSNVDFIIYVLSQMDFTDKRLSEKQTNKKSYLLYFG